MNSSSTSDDAYAYVMAAATKSMCEEKYSEFLQVLRDWKAARIDPRVVKARVSELFKDHKDLILRINNLLPTEYEIILPILPDLRVIRQYQVKAFSQKVLFVFQDKKETSSKFCQALRDYNLGRIGVQSVIAIVIKLFQGQTDLLLEFYKIWLPYQYQIKLPIENGKQQKKEVVKDCQLPWDVLYIICKTLDLDELFQFSGVCKNWKALHQVYWRNFLASQEPLLLQMVENPHRYFFLTSISNQKVYHLSKAVYDDLTGFSYYGSSSGHMIMTKKEDSLLLVNPFTRRIKVINTSTTLEVNPVDYFAYRFLLAFAKGSTKEFVLVVLCKNSKSLHVYQSRNLGWITYSTKGHPWIIVDIGLLHNTIYVVTDKGNIGVLSLNSTNIKFLKLKCTPSVTSSSHLRLVTCDDQILVVHTLPKQVFNVYKIDFSTMNYVKLETLGDIALFYAPGGKYYALSNPNMWGYESNSVYVIDPESVMCKVYLGNDSKLPEYIKPKGRLLLPPIDRPYLLDWCFRHLYYEVDYSLVE